MDESYSHSRASRRENRSLRNENPIRTTRLKRGFLRKSDFSVWHYLGHTKSVHTYWYLSAVPELMALAGDKFERFVARGGADDA